MAVSPAGPIKAVCYYARKDQSLYEEFNYHLSNIKSLYHLEMWVEGQILAGDNRVETIDKYLNAADFIFLLLSPDFPASDYYYNREIACALKRHERREARVIPILLRPVLYDQTLFSHLEILPTNASPVTEWSSTDKAFYDVARHVERVSQAFLREREAEERQRKATQVCAQSSIALSPLQSQRQLAIEFSPTQPMPIFIPRRKRWVTAQKQPFFKKSIHILKKAVLAIFILLSSVCGLLWYQHATESVPALGYNTYVKIHGIMFGFDTQHTRDNPFEGQLNPLLVAHLGQQWVFRTGNYVESSPEVAEGVVYVGSSDGKLYAIDASSGIQKWEFRTGYPIISSPAVAGGVVYVGSDDHDLYAIDASSGIQKWVFSTQSDIESSPTVAGGVVYVGSDDHDLYAIDASSGIQKWVFRTQGPITPSAAVAEGMVYVGSNNGKLYAINASTGIQKWMFSTKGDIDSSPAVAEGMVYVGSGDGKLYAINASSGIQKWEFRTGNYVKSSPAVAEGVVYVGSNDGKLYAINASSGSQKWESLTGDSIFSSPTVAEGVVYVGSNDYKLYAIDASTGTQKWEFLTGNYVESSPEVAEGVVYVGSNDHNLYAFTLLGTTH